MSINLSKLSAMSKKTLKSLLRVIAVLIVVLISISYLNQSLSKQVTNVVEQKNTLSTLQSEVKTLSTQIKQKESFLQDKGILTSKMVTKDSFISFLGKSCELANVQILRMESGSSLSTGSVKSVNFKFELSGSTSNIKSIIQSIDSMGTIYSIRTLSLRKDGKYKWLSRDFDDASGLGWLQFDKTTLPVQNIPLPQALPEIVLDEKGEIVEIKDNRLTSISDLLSGEKIALFLDINFLVAA